MNRGNFNKEWKEYINGFYEDHQEDEYTYKNNNDVHNENWLLGFDYSSIGNQWDKSRILRYKHIK
ncbi:MULTISPECIES: hypothetical protein [unclassified Clostridium]|uniref:hypothetical protein n=1 Tax=unclassified Clostridium TaxID=2614128 RepID=UPI00207A1C89|nr:MULTISPECIES: hypothetical protein [unclassified Clostridium]